MFQKISTATMSILQILTAGGPLNWTTTIPTILITTLAVLYLVYQRILPKPLPGIPYNKDALKSPLGDLPRVIEAAKTTGDITAWMQKEVNAFNSPISQMFMFFPFWKPVVIISDAREIEDILLRRTPKEFDRSANLRAIFEGIVPDHQIMLETNAKWKAHRRLLQDLMSPFFLRGTASGAIHDKVVDLISLWEAKSELTGGRAFSAKDDIHLAALDAVMMFSFGDSIGEGSISHKLSHLSSLSDEDKRNVIQGVPSDGAVDIPEGELDETTKWILELGDSVEAIRKVFIKRLTWKYWRATRLRKAVAQKREFILGHIDMAVKEMEEHAPDDESWIRSAVDHIVTREKKYAKKEGRKPDYTSDMILEETFGFIIAGHDTTSTTAMWSMKILADNPQEQNKLRKMLQDTFPRALAERRLLTNAEIHDTHIPYLDAAIEELMRCSPTLPINSRTTTRDTVILGHVIPKDTVVFLQGAQHGVHLPPYAIDESKRSETSRNAKLQGKSTAAWNEDDMGQFKPDRWLKKDEGDAAQRFDSMAGPHLGFGLGMRGCYGRRLAYVEMRSLVVSIVWRFILDRCPEEVSGYGAIDGITRRPKKCFVKLRDAY